MGKYYYVSITNANEPEMREALKNVTSLGVLYYSGPSVSYLNNVKSAIFEKTETFLGIRYKSKYVGYKGVPMICELRKTKEGVEYFSDVVTGKAYLKSVGYSNKPEAKIRLRSEEEAHVGKVAEFLRSLTDDDIVRYKNAINNLDYYAKIGYENYLRRLNNTDIKQRQDEEFIRKFRNYHGR